MSYNFKRYLIEFFDGTVNPEYEEYAGDDAYEAVAKFRENHPKATLQNVCLILHGFNEEEQDND